MGDTHTHTHNTQTMQQNEQQKSQVCDIFITYFKYLNSISKKISYIKDEHKRRKIAL
jgi:hypothetical protein